MAQMICFLLLALISPLSLAQYPPTPSGITTVQSKADPDVTISFKEIDICERTPGVKSYSGFVHLPGSSLTDIGGFDINSHFLYFEARQNADTAPLAIYLAGGPGESSTYSAFDSEGGPCYVNIEGTDTIHNPWSLNNHVNMLYIDQPVQTGFSYDKLTNATFDLLSFDGLITPLAKSSSPPVNGTFGYGTFSSQNIYRTSNTTVQAARALWYFAENFLSSFPGYTTQSTELNVWGNSYGGYWVPETAAQLDKNLKSLPAKHPLKSKGLAVDSIGITNGCVDFITSVTAYPIFAYNNTYGIRFGSKALYEEVLHNITKPGGCNDQVEQCRSFAMRVDPNDTGSNAKANALCETAFIYCLEYVVSSFPELQTRDAFDIAQPGYPNESPLLPCDFYLPVFWYLNTAHIQQALGVPLNFTYDSNLITAAFGLPGPFPVDKATGDFVRQNGMPDLAYLVANGVKVAFVYGDRDYRCPWTLGEQTALALNWEHQADFAKAGYEVMQGIVTPVEEGGREALVKQYGQVSFSRVKDSGHFVNAYAPETVYRIFDRTIRGVDVVTGKESIEGGYHTTGPTTSWAWRNQLPKPEPVTCMVEGQFQDTNPWDAALNNTHLLN